jgi:hypothetical protein
LQFVRHRHAPVPISGGEKTTMIQKPLISCASLLALFAVPAAAIILPVEEDTSSNGKNALTAKAGAAGTLLVNAKQQAFIQFNAGGLQGVIDSQNVTAARLKIYFTSASKPGDLTIHRVTSAWAEATAGDEPSFESTPLVTIPAADVVKKEFVVVDITSTVRGWILGPVFGFEDHGLAITTSAPLAKVAIGAKEGSGSGYPAELEIDVAGGNLLPDGSVTSAKLSGNIDTAKLAAGSVSNAEFSHLDGATANLQIQLNGKASLVHTHSAADITSGTLSDARLSSNIARKDTDNLFSVGQNLIVATQDALSSSSTSGGGTWINLDNTSTGGRRFNFISAGSTTFGGAGKLHIRDADANSVRLTLDSDGDLGIGTLDPQGKLEIATNGQRSIRFKDDLVPSMEVVSSDPLDGLAGILRFRHRLEIQPNAAGTAAGNLDVRNATGAVTINLNGGTGNITAKNLAAIKGTQFKSSVRSNPSAGGISAQQEKEIDVLDVTAPAAGTLLVFANVQATALSENSDDGFYFSLRTGPTATTSTLVENSLIGNTTNNGDVFRGVVSLTWSIPVTSGQVLRLSTWGFNKTSIGPVEYWSHSLHSVFIPNTF